MAAEAERAFLQAPLLERAAILLKESFREPLESVSRRNVALAVVNAVTGSSQGMILGSVAPGGGHRVKQRALRSVAEAWQVLERSGLICEDLEQKGDWWLLTEAGEIVRSSGDITSAIDDALRQA